MEDYNQSINLNHQIKTVETQINRTISDIGRLSSYKLATTNVFASIRTDKLNFLHILKEKKEQLVNLRNSYS